MTKHYTLLFLLSFINLLFCQEISKEKDTLIIKNSIAITNNGISLIPTFSLGKPATIIELSAGNKRFSFDPQLRFGIEDAKPWSFVFWLRYKLVEFKKFKLGIGAHPSFLFSTTPAVINGVTKDVIITKRFVAGELVPTFYINKKISLGLYYLHAHGLADATKNTHFVSANGYFTINNIINDYNFKFIPQVYYLNMDTKDGYYTTSTLTISKNKFPFSISTSMNQKIKSSIVSKDFIWNVSLNYSFGGKYSL